MTVPPAGPGDDAEASALDARSADDRDDGWSEPADVSGDDWYLQERPPHWD